MSSLDPSRSVFDHDHNTIDITNLKKTIVQLDPENGPSLDTLLENHKQRLIKRAKGNGLPTYLLSHGRGYACLDCVSYDVETMSRDKFLWHALTK